MHQRDIEQLIDKKLQDFKQKNLSFRSKIPMDRPADRKSLGNLNLQLSITGSKGANAALTSLITKLATVGIVVDNTS